MFVAFLHMHTAHYPQHARITELVEVAMLSLNLFDILKIFHYAHLINCSSLVFPPFFFFFNHVCQGMVMAMLPVFVAAANIISSVAVYTSLDRNVACYKGDLY